MVLAALSKMGDSLSSEISKVNARVDALIINPPGIVPSSQPYDDYGDFALPTSQDGEYRNWTQAPDNLSDPLFDHAMADQGISKEALYFDLTGILVSSNCCLPRILSLSSHSLYLFALRHYHTFSGSAEVISPFRVFSRSSKLCACPGRFRRVSLLRPLVPPPPLPTPNQAS
jgi:hypothetical protein